MKHFDLARYRNRLVAARTLRKRLCIGGEHLKELREIRLHHHENLLRFIGLVVQSDRDVTIVAEYTQRGSLADFIVREECMQKSDWAFRYSLLHDLFEVCHSFHLLSFQKMLRY